MSSAVARGFPTFPKLHLPQRLRSAGARAQRLSKDFCQIEFELQTCTTVENGQRRAMDMGWLGWAGLGWLAPNI
jgi:hypothetical protein